MTDKLVIALAQMTQSVGDLKANADAMLEWRARASGADLIVYPELQLIGYPPEDLVLKPALVTQANYQLDRLAQETADGGPAMLVGTVVAAQGVLFNVVALLDRGAVTAVRAKRELPNYGTFDEKRLFAPGPLPAPIDFRGVKIGVAKRAWMSADITGAPNRLSVGMSKKPWICPACRSTDRTRLAPAVVMRLATSLALIGVRGPGLRSWRA